MSNRPVSTKPLRVARDLAAAADLFAGGVVAIGNFDGVHRGHRAVIDAAIDCARPAGRKAFALTFEPHPRKFFRPAEPMFRLSDASTKLRLLAGTGLDGALVLTFDAALAETPADVFVADLLVGRLAIAGAAMGFDFHFGKDRRGSPEFLAAQGRHFGFPVEIVSRLENAQRPVSSSAIRQALSAGRVEEASELLGFPWFVSATVLQGDKRGRDLGFPTANLRLDPACDLRHGIYAVRARLDERQLDGVASFGRRPTFDDGPPLLEVNLFDFTDDIYGATIDVAFIGWIRPELKFDAVSDLIDRMREDSRLARVALAHSASSFPPLGPVEDA